MISKAIAKYLYEGQQPRQHAYMAVIMALAPMLAQMLGGMIMDRLSWNWVFFMQAVMGMIALLWDPRQISAFSISERRNRCSAIVSALFVLGIWLPVVKKLDLNAGE